MPEDHVTKILRPVQLSELCVQGKPCTVCVIVHRMAVIVRVRISVHARREYAREFLLSPFWGVADRLHIAGGVIER